MSRVPRLCLATVLVGLAAFAAWRIGTDAIAGSSPDAALRPQPRSAGALVGRQGIDVDPGTGSPYASAVLAREPLHGWAFAAIADAAEASRAEALHRIAVRRAPRLIAPRVWLVNHGLRTRDYGEAMRHLDVLLRLSPPYRAYLYPRLMELSSDPAFVDALAATLRRQPPWRAEFVSLLQSDAGDGGAHALVSHLALRDALHPDEFGLWIDRMIEAGRWGEAYAQWAGAHTRLPRRIAAVPDGSFAAPPTGRGFGWRFAEVPGARLQFSEAPGTRGLAAHVEFPGRPVAGTGLEHPLFVGPGTYRLRVRMRAASLQGIEGLRWTLACETRANVVARSSPVSGSFDWREVVLDFSVPPSGCEGQWLQLVNAAPAGAAQVLAGEVWFDDVSIGAVTKPVRPGAARLQGGATAVLHSTGADFVTAARGTSLAEGDRLIGVSRLGATIAYAGGCVDALPPRATYTVREASCGGGAYRGSAIGPGLLPRAIVVLPEAEAWPLPPIGR